MMLGSTTGHCGGLETDAEGGDRAGWEITEAQQHWDSVGERLEVRGDSMDQSCEDSSKVTWDQRRAS